MTNPTIGLRVGQDGCASIYKQPSGVSKYFKEVSVEEAKSLAHAMNIWG